MSLKDETLANMSLDTVQMRMEIQEALLCGNISLARIKLGEIDSNVSKCKPFFLSSFDDDLCSFLVIQQAQSISCSANRNLSSFFGTETSQRR